MRYNLQQQNTIDFKQVKKTYKFDLFGRLHFDLGPFNHSFQPGSATAIVGANGSGKTTIVKLLLGLLLEDAGSISVGGSRVSFRKHIGFMPEVNKLPSIYSACELLEQHQKYYALEKVQVDKDYLHSWLLRFGIDKHKNIPIKFLSKGLKRKVALAMALFHSPRVLVLDEPFEGMDYASNKLVLDEIKSYRTASNILIICSHDIDSLVDTCEHLIVLENGSVVEKLSLATGKTKYCIRIAKTDVNSFREYRGILKAVVYEDHEHVDFCFDSYKRASDAISFALASKIEIVGFFQNLQKDIYQKKAKQVLLDRRKG
jgi:Cu-processing system ATP-binding protein